MSSVRPIRAKPTDDGIVLLNAVILFVGPASCSPQEKQRAAFAVVAAPHIGQVSVCTDCVAPRSCGTFLRRITPYAKPMKAPRLPPNIAPPSSLSRRSGLRIKRASVSVPTTKPMADHVSGSRNFGLDLPGPGPGGTGAACGMSLILKLYTAGGVVGIQVMTREPMGLSHRDRMHPSDCINFDRRPGSARRRQGVSLPFQPLALFTRFRRDKPVGSLDRSRNMIPPANRSRCSACLTGSTHSDEMHLSRGRSGFA